MRVGNMYSVKTIELVIFLSLMWILGFVIGMEYKQIEINKIKKHNKVCCLDGGWNCE